MQWQATTILDGSSGSESVTAPQLHLASPIGKVPFRLLSEIQTETLPEIKIDEMGPIRVQPFRCAIGDRWWARRKGAFAICGSEQHVTSNAPPAARHICAPARTTASQAPGRRCRRARTAAH